MCSRLTTIANLVLGLILTVLLRPLPAAAILCGDLNASDTVTTADAVLLYRAVVENPDPAPLCGGNGALGCGDVGPLNNPDGTISTADAVVLYGSVLGSNGTPPHYLVCDPGSCETNMDEGPWTTFFSSTLQPVPAPYQPPTHPSQCTSGGSSILTTSSTPGSYAVAYGAQGYTGSPRVTDITFYVPSADFPNFNHIFVGSGESDSVGGHIGVAIGDIGYVPGTPTLYIEVVRHSNPMPGCTVPGDQFIAGAPGPQDDTWLYYPGNGGVVLAQFQANRWYRAASIVGKRNDGGISVTATWQDLLNGDFRSTSFDFPPECTPDWWDTSDHRPWFGVVPTATGASVNVFFSDLFIRPARF